MLVNDSNYKLLAHCIEQRREDEVAMKISLKKSRISQHGCHTLVVFAPPLATDKKVNLKKLDPSLNMLLQEALNEGAFSGRKKEIVFYRHAKVVGATHILFVGLGDPKIGTEAARVAGATAVLALRGQKITNVAFDLDSLTRNFKDAAHATQGLVEGIQLASYEFNDHKSKNKDKAKDEKKLTEILLVAESLPKVVENAKELGEVLAEYTNLARWFGDSPANAMTPSILAKHAQQKAKGLPLKVTIWDKARLEKENMGGILAVAQGSSQEPRFIIMEYNGGPKGQKPVCFVGKGLTFDCGGISIKPAANMDEMKYDMCGGAAVVAALLAIARLRLKVNVIGLVPSTENLVGPEAVKPGDVMVARNGKTVEILNTDAEGRLILADALSYASEQKPQVIFSTATLTGAIVVALGNIHTGLFSRDQKLVERIKKASHVTGELVWQMPVTDDHVEDMKGYHADLSNISNNKGAGSATAAAFLEQFVGEGLPFAHLDIAGTAWNVSNRLNYAPKKGAQGVMVRTFVELAKSFA